MSSGGKKEKRIFINATMHLVILGVFLLLQLILAGLLSYYLQRLSIAVMIALYLISIVADVFISAYHDNPSTRIFWLLLIALFPAFGLIIYFMWGLPRHGARSHAVENRSQKAADTALNEYSKQIETETECCSESLSRQYPAVRNASRYLSVHGFPPFSGTKVTYFPTGESFFDDCLLTLKKAQKNIFLSFFILREGMLWSKFYEILVDKAKQGVDVRILLDDAGTMFNISVNFIDELNRAGIHVLLFNPTHRYLNNLYLNYRNHQKIIIIDSDTGYTGGMNLADEYSNYTSPFGHWKDTGVRLDGHGVYGLTVTFLNMWDQTEGRLSDSYALYRPTQHISEEGFCQVFSDGPANNPQNPAEGLIYRMIESAAKYVYLTTPYLAVSQPLIDTICRAARSGVRVVLLVPYQLDHWYVFEVTQSHFPALIDAGVEVYRYSPGMLHAKMIVADDIHALVSTINLDNRSFYSQYEDGVWFCGKDAVSHVKKDIENTIGESKQVTLGDLKKIGKLRSLFGLLLRAFSPLM